MPFQDNNTTVGLPPTNNFQVGRANADDNAELERGVLLPWSSSPAGSYVYYDCTVGVMLDSGIVVHNRLPQVNRASDTLASALLNSASLDQVIDKGVNLECQDQYADIVQRMGHSRYWFRLWGQALRIGYQVPIPGINTIGGVRAVPYDRNPQWAFNGIVPGGNYGGVILWRARWSLWYTTAVPPISQAIPVADPSALVLGNTTPPIGIQAPFSQADDNAQNTQVQLTGFSTNKR